jgi:hypothetical protein
MLVAGLAALFLRRTLHTDDTLLHCLVAFFRLLG